MNLFLLWVWHITDLNHHAVDLAYQEYREVVTGSRLSIKSALLPKVRSCRYTHTFQSSPTGCLRVMRVLHETWYAVLDATLESQKANGNILRQLKGSPKHASSWACGATCGLPCCSV